MKTGNCNIMVWVAGVVLMAGSAFGQVIRMQKEIAVDVHQDVRLGDVAKVSGTDGKTAESLANLVILPDLRESRTLRAEAVLTAVIGQIGPGTVADHLQVSGSATCDVKIETQNAKSEIRNPKPEMQSTNKEPAIEGASTTSAAAVVKEVQGPTLAKQ